MFSAILKSLSYAMAPFTLLGIGWAWGFLTREMLDFHPMLLLTIIISVVALCISLAHETHNTPNERYSGVIVAIMTVFLFSFAYEAIVDKNAKRGAEEKARQEKEELRQKNHKICLEEIRKSRPSSEIPECNP